jgi:hypothetical protein
MPESPVGVVLFALALAAAVIALGFLAVLGHYWTHDLGEGVRRQAGRRWRRRRSANNAELEDD